MCVLVREIVHDPILLSRKSRMATAEDLSIADDLLDTLSFHRERCVGMAANMIGEFVRIIVFDDNGTAKNMLNPTILQGKDPYEAEEGCLSLDGTRKTMRYRKIKVQWQDRQFRTRIKTFEGWTAQIIQHELDHCDGKLI